MVWIIKLDPQESTDFLTHQTKQPYSHGRRLIFHVILIGALAFAGIPLWRAYQDQVAAEQAYQEVGGPGTNRWRIVKFSSNSANEESCLSRRCGWAVVLPPARWRCAEIGSCIRKNAKSHGDEVTRWIWIKKEQGGIQTSYKSNEQKITEEDAGLHFGLLTLDNKTVWFTWWVSDKTILGGQFRVTLIKKCSEDHIINRRQTKINLTSFKSTSDHWEHLQSVTWYQKVLHNLALRWEVNPKDEGDLTNFNNAEIITVWMDEFDKPINNF